MMSHGEAFKGSKFHLLFGANKNIHDIFHYFLMLK